MEQVIVDLIDACALNAYPRLSDSKRIALRKKMYVGVQVALNRRTIDAMAVEVEYSYHYTFRIYRQWKKLVEDMNPLVVSIVRAYNNLTLNGYMPSQYTPKRAPWEGGNPDDHYTKYLGMSVTRKEEDAMQNAIRGAIAFMETYGKGDDRPRWSRRFSVEDTNVPEAVSHWLTLTSAALYCACSPSDIEVAARLGIVERRRYNSGSRRLYYEYSVESLDRYKERKSVKAKRDKKNPS